MTNRLLQRAAFCEAGHCAAAITFGIPILRVSIAANVPHLHRARYRPQHNAGRECLATLCFAGPAAERLFCGPIKDGADQFDIDTARRYLADRFDALQIGVELVRCRDAANRLVRSEWAQRRIGAIAAALLRQGALDGQAIAALGS